MAATAETPINNQDRKRVTLSEPEREWLQKHPVITGAVDPKWPPFSSYDKQGTPSGITVETVRLIASRTGLNLKLLRTADWSETLNKVITGEIDFVAGIAQTEQRERVNKLRFTDPFCKFPTAIITHKDRPFFTTMRHLAPRRIAAPRDYAATEELMKLLPNAHYLLTETEEESMLMVSGAKADATVLNLASASYIVHMRGLGNLKISGFTDMDFFLRFAVRDDSPELYSILQKGLASIDKNEQEAIFASYIQPETLNAINWKVWRRRAIEALLIGIAALIVVLLWNRSLAREIRRRAAVEAALVKSRGELESYSKELLHHTMEMRALNEKLSGANKDLEFFSSSVSHDLKSPLRRLRGFAGLLQQDADSRLNQGEKHYLLAIDQQARRMSDLVDDLLDFARIGGIEAHLAPTDLEQLTHEIVKELETETKEREIIWQIKALPTMECDRGLIKQVVANLIDNAVKFTRGRSPARIETGVLPNESLDPEVVFYVKDNGIGFDPAKANALFEPFHRLHTQQEFEGSGIGLTNVKRIVQRHGGRVWAEGEAGKGATFYFSLPRRKTAVRAEQFALPALA